MRDPAANTNLTLLSNTTITTSNALNVSGTGGVTVSATAAATLDSIAFGSGGLSVTAPASPSRWAGLVGAGAASFTPAAKRDHADQHGNNLTGTVALNNSGANNVALVTSSTLQLATSGVGSGTLGITAAVR